MGGSGVWFVASRTSLSDREGSGMGTVKLTGSSMEDPDKSVSDHFNEALESAVNQEPERTGNAPRIYSVMRSWFEAGGVVGGRIYYVELAIAGADVPDA